MIVEKSQREPFLWIHDSQEMENLMASQFAMSQLALNVIKKALQK